MRIALGLLAALTATAAAAAPYRLATDAADSAWVIDEATGALHWYRGVAGVGPKVIDVFGGFGEARQPQALPERPDCRLALRPDAGANAGDPLVSIDGYAGTFAVAVAPGMLGDGSSGLQVGSSVGMLGDGTFGFGDGYGVPDTQVIIFRPERVDFGLP